MSNQSKLLLFASIIGTLLAIYSIMDSNKNFSSLPNDVVATVNDKIIPSERYQTVIQLIENDKRGDLTDIDRKMALERIIEEELLVQYAYQNGFLEADDLLRKSIVRSVVDSIVEQSISVLPEKEILRDFYQDNLPVFTLDEQYRIVILSSQDRSDITAAKQIWQQSYDIQKLENEIESIRQLEIPSGFISKLRLGTLIGPLLREVVLSIRIGETSKPIETIYGYSIVTLIDKKNKIVPEYSEIQEVVLQEFRRRQREDILDELLIDLKRQSDININNSLSD
ncbi:MAG: peptidylprolyl isomerase [Gammaproteobacteria bacterium]|nr:peptidylprolyl isomerase [Gammaproteobacteria bacterium]